MRRVLVVLCACAAVGLIAAAPGTASPGDVKVSDQAYVRHDGGSDATIASCSVNNRQQNEPSAAVDPTHPAHMVAGANDYCSVPTGGGTWAGFYYSSNGGATWTNSLLPGYPTDTSAEGMASPLFGLVNNAGDPVQAWDRMGHLYYGGVGVHPT